MIVGLLLIAAYGLVKLFLKKIIFLLFIVKKEYSNEPPHCTFLNL
jgi:hypothetical protein